MCDRLFQAFLAPNRVNKDDVKAIRCIEAFAEINHTTTLDMQNEHNLLARSLQES